MRYVVMAVCCLVFVGCGPFAQSCQQQVEPLLGTIQRTALTFNGQLRAAEQATSAERQAVLTDIAATKQTAESIQVPSCFEDSYSVLLGAMDDTITGLEQQTNNVGSQNPRIQQARDKYDQFVELMFEE